MDGMQHARPMRLIETTIDIQALVTRVWSILTAFSFYPAWNPFIIAAEGEARPATRLKNHDRSTGTGADYLSPRRPRRRAGAGTALARSPAPPGAFRW